MKRTPSCLFSLAACARGVAIALFAVGAQDSCGVVRWSATALHLKPLSGLSCSVVAIASSARFILQYSSFSLSCCKEFLPSHSCLIVVASGAVLGLHCSGTVHSCCRTFLPLHSCLIVVASGAVLRLRCSGSVHPRFLFFFLFTGFFFKTPLFLYADFFLAYVICFHKSGRSPDIKGVLLVSCEREVSQKGK